MILGGVLLWLSAAGLMGFERYRKKQEEDRQIREIADQLEKIRRNEDLQLLPDLEDPGSKRIADALESLGSYVETIRSQAHQEKEKTKMCIRDSPYTVLGESVSAGRLYDRIGDTAAAKIVYVTERGIICRVCRKSLDDFKEKPVTAVSDEDL